MATAEVEWGFLTALVASGSYQDAVRYKVTDKSFADDDAREAFNSLVRHHEKHGALPSYLLVSEVVPGFVSMESSDPISALAEQLKKEELYNDLGVETERIILEAREDPSQALAALQEAAAKLARAHTPQLGINATADAHSVMDRYRKTKALVENGQMVGYPYPWEYLNSLTLGFRPGQYGVIFAPPKCLKTWVLCHIAKKIHELGESVLVISQEIPVEEFHDRIGAVYGGVQWGGFYTGKMLAEEEDKLQAGLDAFHDGAPMHIHRVHSLGLDAVAEVFGLAKEYGTKAILWDGIYLAAERDWQIMGRVNMRVKQRVMDEERALLATAQENRQGTISNRSFEQDADLLLQITREEEHKQKRELQLEAPFFRNAEAEPFLIHAQPASNFSQKAVLVSGVTGMRLKGDDEPDDDTGADATPKHVAKTGTVKPSHGKQQVLLPKNKKVVVKKP